MKTSVMCEECNVEFESQEFVYRHIRSHSMTTQEYMVEVKPDNLVGAPMNEAKKHRRYKFLRQK